MLTARRPFPGVLSLTRTRGKRHHPLVNLKFILCEGISEASQLKREGCVEAPGHYCRPPVLAVRMEGTLGALLTLSLSSQASV